MRLAVLVAIFVVLAVTLVPTLRSFVGQQNQIAAARTTLVQQQDAVNALQQEQLKWADPAYVQQQARQRLKFVKIGETPYTVLGAPAVDGSLGGAAADAAGKASVTPLSSTSGPTPAWYAKAWGSMTASDPYVSAGTGTATAHPAR